MKDIASNNEKPKIIILCGPSGSGKSTLVDLITKKHCNFKILSKGSTRPIRKDDVDLKFEPNFSPSNYDYSYSLYGAKYGIKKDLLLKGIQNREHQLIICSNFPTIHKIKNDFQTNTLVIGIFRYFDTLSWVETMRKRGLSETEIRARLHQNQKFKLDLENENHSMDAVIRNVDKFPPEMMLQDFELFFGLSNLISTKEFDRLKNVEDLVKKEIDEEGHLFDLFELKPNIFGIGINLNEIIKRIIKWFKKRKKGSQ